MEQQHLFYAGKRLDDGKSLADYNIHDESVLKLKVGQIMRIFVETRSGEKIELEVLPSDTIREIKAQIYEIKGIVSAQQQLFFADENLEDDKTLQDYRIKRESTLVLKLG